MSASATPVREIWDLWQDGVREPALNMALDEALLLTAAARQRPVLRFYGWDRPAVTIGYVQRHAAAPAGFAGGDRDQLPAGDGAGEGDGGKRRSDGATKRRRGRKGGV